MLNVFTIVFHTINGKKHVLFSPYGRPIDRIEDHSVKR